MTDEYFPQHVVYCGEECVVSRQQLLKEASSAISAIEANMNAPARSASSSPSPLPVLRSSKGEYVPEPTSNVYTGALGVAHMHWTLFKHTHGNSLHPAGAGEAHAKRALALLAQCGEEAALHRSLERDVSLRGGMAYYMGDAGLHTLGCALHAGTPWGSAKLAGKHARALIRIAQAAAVPGACHGVREVLYGQAGLLYCLRAVADTVGMPLSGEAATLGAAVAQSICSAGIDPCGVAQTTGEDAWPMMWQFGRSEYLGAAHGVVGIAYMLLDWVPELLPEHRQRLVALVTRITELCLTSESLPVAASLRFDTALFHWCHGTPGAILLLVKAFQIFGTPQFLDAARCAAGVLWQRGMLRKGSGLCHGIHGNAYAFLALYRATGEEQYVFCAKSFHAASLSGPYLAAVQSYTDEQRDVQNIPDSPYSLMEGAAGVVCFLYDLLAPLRSAFPGFETPPRFDCRFQPQGLPAPVFAFTTSKVRPLLPGSIWEVDALDAASCESLAALAESTVTAEELAARGIKLAETTFHSVLAQCKSLVLRVLEENAQMPPRAVTPSRAVRHPTFFDQLKGKLLKVKEPPPAAASAAPPPLFDLASADGAPRLSFVAAYVVRYDSVHHPRIHSHRDACDVTLNVCLRKTCAMSSLYFDDARLSYQHVPGKAVVHWASSCTTRSVCRAKAPARSSWRFTTSKGSAAPQAARAPGRCWRGPSRTLSWRTSSRFYPSPTSPGACTRADGCTLSWQTTTFGASGSVRSVNGIWTSQALKILPPGQRLPSAQSVCRQPIDAVWCSVTHASSSRIDRTLPKGACACCRRLPSQMRSSCAAPSGAMPVAAGTQCQPTCTICCRWTLPSRAGRTACGWPPPPSAPFPLPLGRFHRTRTRGLQPAPWRQAARTPVTRGS